VLRKTTKPTLKCRFWGWGLAEAKKRCREAASGKRAVCFSHNSGLASGSPASHWLLEGTHDEFGVACSQWQAHPPLGHVPNWCSAQAGCRVKREGQQPATAVSGCPKLLKPIITDRFERFVGRLRKTELSQTSINSAGLGGRTRL
jgi:hypothetical protein